MSNVLDFITRHLTDDEWMEDAACKGMTHLFFPLPQNAHRLVSVVKMPLGRFVNHAQ